MKKIILLLFTILSINAFSQYFRKDSINLENVTITAFRADIMSPVTFKNINKEEIENIYFGQEPVVVLNFTPSITINSDAGNQFGYSQFRIRGIDQTRINVTLDGIPLNEPEDQGLYFNNYPDLFNSIQSVQIQRGVGTSTNGIAAFGGSINMESVDIFTKDSFFNGFTGYGSYGTSRLAMEYGTGTSDDGYAAYVRVSNIQTDGYIDNAFHRGKSAFYSIGRKWNNNTLKLVGFTGQHQNGMAWLGATQEQLVASPRSNGNFEHEQDMFTNSMTSLQYTKLWKKTKMNATTYYNILDGNYDVDLNHFGFDAVQNIALKHHFIGSLLNVTQYIENGKITAGINANQFNRQHTGTFDSEFGYQNTGFRNMASAFVTADYNIRKLRVYADVQKRFSDFRYEGDAQIPTQQWGFINYRGGLNYQINERYSAYYSYGQTSREPTRNDLFGGFDNLDLDFFQELEPETVRNHEGGIRFNSDKIIAQVNAYLMNFNNEIALTGFFGPNSLLTTESFENSYRRGIELDMSYNISSNWSVFFQFTQSENRILSIDDDGNTQKRSHVLTPETMSNLGVNYTYRKWGFSVLARYQGNSYLDLENTEKIDSFTVLNLRTSYSEGPFMFSLWVNNVTNQVYNTSGVIMDQVRYFRQAPINAFLSIAVSL